MTRQAGLLAGLLLVVFCPGCATGPDPRRATPRLTAETMVQAMIEGDKSTVRSCVIVDSDQRKLADGVMTLTHGMTHAGTAVRQRWGGEIDRQFGEQLDVARLRPEMVNSAEETISGDNATLVTSLLTLAMVRQKDGWRIDLIKSIGADPQMIKYAMPIFSALGRACNDVAGEIDAGKYATRSQAMNALQDRTSAALQSEVRKIAVKEIRSQFFWP